MQKPLIGRLRIVLTFFGRSKFFKGCRIVQSLSLTRINTCPGDNREA